MNFFNPLAFVGLVTIPIIIAMYLLKQKYKQKTVSSLFLWKNALNMSKAQRPFQKLRRNLLMFLQLLLAFLLVFSIANPFFSAQELSDKTIIVIDASMSMQATDVLPTRFDKAKDEVSALVNGLKPNSQTAVVVACKTPYILSNFTTDKRTILQAIKQLQPTFETISEKETKTLVEMLSEKNDVSVFAFSDYNMDLGDTLKQDVYFGENTDNTAITLLSHSVDAQRVMALVKVKNYGNKRVENSVSMFYDDILLDVKDIVLQPNEEKDVFFTTLPLDARNLTAKLTENDYLPQDDVFYSVVNLPVKKRVTLVADKNIFLENVLSIMPNVELLKATSENMETLEGSALYVFDGVLPQNLPNDGHILIFNPPIGNTFIETAEDVFVTDLQVMDNDLLALVNDLNFDIEKSKHITTPTWAKSLLTSDETDLIVQGELDGKKVVVMGFDIHNTDLPLKKEFPIFMYNLMQFFIPSNVATVNGLQSGDVVTLNTRAGAKDIQVYTPTNETVVIAPPFPVSPFDKTQATGFYTLAETTAKETFYSTFAVNATSEESNLISEQNAENQTFAQSNVSVNKNLTWIFILLVLTILTIEWWVFSRGR